MVQNVLPLIKNKLSDSLQNVQLIFYISHFIFRAGHVSEVPGQRNVEFDIFIFGGGTVVSI